MWANKLSRWMCAISVCIVASFASASPGHAYLYWIRPNFTGATVQGNEPGIALPLPDATPAEIRANLVWNLRAALNVAALQCQFAAPLMTVRNYNTLLSQHGVELNTAYNTLNNYFRRTAKGKWQRAFDTHTTRTYNGFSTMHAQIGFCETAGRIGRLALGARKGDFHDIATAYMQEMRNSLIPAGDAFFGARTWLTMQPLPPLDDKCWDRRGNLKKKCELVS
jgi:hypothetical protein